MTRLTNALGASTLASFSYGYDHDWTSGSDTMLGQRTSMTANVPAQGLTAAESRYSYDPLYQLVKAQYPAGAVFGGETHEWTYDALGNRLSSKVNGTGPGYSYLKNGTNTQNGQRLSSDGVNAYSYDANGSQLTRTGPGGNYGFGYDADNRLTSITGSETATSSYDYQGRRISKTEAGLTTTYLYDGLNPIAETVSTSPKYVLNGPSIDEPLAISASGTISYLNADGLGSIIATNNAAGTVTHSLTFDAWGVPKNETGTRAHGYTYTGREAGVAGMHFYRARFLQAGVGRFTQEDRARFLGGLNQFRYADGDPALLSDPIGLKVLNPRDLPVSPEVVDALWEFNALIGCDKDIQITDGNRDPNAKIGAGQNSTHVLGVAADIFVLGQTHLETANQAAASGLFAGVGWYQEGYRGPRKSEGPHVHVDLRTTGPARWGFSKTGEYSRGFPTKKVNLLRAPCQPCPRD